MLSIALCVCWPSRLCARAQQQQQQSGGVARVQNEAQLQAAISRGTAFVVITSHMRLTKSLRPSATLTGIVVRLASGLHSLQTPRTFER